jgi:hypothetical protein
MWKLQSEENKKRTYINSTTGSQCAQSMVFTDKEGNNWFQFDDLMMITYTRQFAATKISSLYSLGLTKEDLNSHINGLKAILKSTSPEKYERAYSFVIDFENKANNATDAVKQMTALTCVYFTLNNEPIDSFDNNLQIKKMSILEADIDAHAFFLSLQI